MKRVLFGLCLLFLANLTFAQVDFLFGLRGGMNSSSVKMDEMIIENTASKEKWLLSAGASKVGFHGGFVSRIEVLMFFVQPELLFTHSSSEIKVEDITKKTVTDKLQKFNKVDIPIMMGLKTGPVRFQLGPVATIMLSSTSEVKDLTGYEDKFNSAVWGGQAGLGIDILDKISIDAKYQFGLSKLGDNVTYSNNTYNTNSKERMWLLSLGYFF